MNNQTVRHEDDSPGIGDDDMDDFISPQKKIEREPEREPDDSGLEGNITHSILEKEKGLKGKIQFGQG